MIKKSLLMKLILEIRRFFFKGEPLYLKTSDGLQTETSFIRLKSSGELIIPKKIEVKSLK